jgi:hypothetical protein
MKELDFEKGHPNGGWWSTQLDVLAMSHSYSSLPWAFLVLSCLMALTIKKNIKQSTNLEGLFLSIQTKTSLF